MQFVDLAIIIIVFISSLFGLQRGFIKELLSVVFLLLSSILALKYGGDFGGSLLSWIDSITFRFWSGVVLLFFIFLFLGSLLNWGISKLIKMSLINGINRFLGMIFGFLRGCVLISLVVMLMQSSTFSINDWWLNSPIIPYAEIFADWMRIMIPENFDMINNDIEFLDES